MSHELSYDYNKGRQSMKEEINKEIDWFVKKNRYLSDIAEKLNIQPSRTKALIEAIKDETRQSMKEDVLKVANKLVSFTCSCNCVTFEGQKCKACGKSYKYGQIDYDEFIEKLKELG